MKFLSRKFIPTLDGLQRSRLVTVRLGALYAVPSSGPQSPLSHRLVSGWYKRKLCSKFLPPPPPPPPVHSLMSILRLAFLFVVIYGLWSLVKFRWIVRAIVYLRRNTPTSRAIANAFYSIEDLERAVSMEVHAQSNAANPPPEDIQQRWARMPERLQRY